MRALIIEDDLLMSKSIQLILQSKGFVCDTTTIGEDGLGIARHYEYDIVLLDLMLPDMDGYDILRRLRAVNIQTPVLIISALSEVDLKVKGLNYGADDYMTKPFNKDELLSRVQAIVRRSKGHADSVITVGKLKIDTNLRTVTANDRQVVLTAREYSILELLMLRHDAILTKETFLNHLYGGMEEPEAKIIDVFVCKLRKKLDPYLNSENYIETVWGRGYVLREPNKNENLNNFINSPIATPTVESQHLKPLINSKMQKPTLPPRPSTASMPKSSLTQASNSLMGHYNSASVSSRPVTPAAQSITSSQTPMPASQRQPQSMSQSMPSNMQKPIVGVQRSQPLTNQQAPLSQSVNPNSKYSLQAHPL